MKILALDPAARCGFAHTDGHCGAWNLGTGAQRLQLLDERISRAIEDWGCDVIAYESASFGSHNQHTKSRHNELSAIVQLVAAREQIKCWSWNPMQWKAIALGKGNLDKQGVMRLLRIVYGIEVSDPDIADAICILHCAMKGPPPETKKAASRRARKLEKKLPRLFR